MGLSHGVTSDFQIGATFLRQGRRPLLSSLNGTFSFCLSRLQVLV
jgi:hypothetical protein